MTDHPLTDDQPTIEEALSQLVPSRKKAPTTHQVFKYSVYDRVWIMEDNKPKQKIIFAVIESMAHFKRGTEIHYRLVDGTFGTGWGNNEGICRGLEDIFSTKDELLKSLAA